MREQIAVFIQANYFLVVQCGFFHVGSTRTAPRVVHYRTDRNHFHIFQRDSVILHFLPGIAYLVEAKFSGFERLACRRSLKDLVV